jgi:hypothetical protein
MQKTLYRLVDGVQVIVHDAVDAKEYIATGRYSDKPIELPAVAEPVVIERPAQGKANHKT